MSLGLLYTCDGLSLQQVLDRAQAAGIPVCPKPMQGIPRLAGVVLMAREDDWTYILLSQEQWDRKFAEIPPPLRVIDDSSPAGCRAWAGFHWVEKEGDDYILYEKVIGCICGPYRTPEVWVAKQAGETNAAA